MLPLELILDLLRQECPLHPLGLILDLLHQECPLPPLGLIFEFQGARTLGLILEFLLQACLLMLPLWLILEL